MTFHLVKKHETQPREFLLGGLDLGSSRKYFPEVDRGWIGATDLRRICKLQEKTARNPPQEKPAGTRSETNLCNEGGFWTLGTKQGIPAVRAD